MRKGWSQWAAVLFAAWALSGCSTIVHKAMVVNTDDRATHKIAIFFDGTHNDIASDTNVKRLHSLISLQDRNDLVTLYVEGVGVGSDILGMGTGLGIGSRVKLAYEFLLNNYRHGDEIYVFGFSRGAFSARILASLLYYAGLPKTSTNGPAAKVAERVFSTVKSYITAGKSKHEIRIALQDLALDQTNIKVLGLWDTVEALGIPDWSSRILDKIGRKPFTVDIDVPNPRYGDQLCNVEYAFHAVSIDDDREWVFTPLLLSRRHLFDACGSDHPTKPKALVLHEVWFSGSHSDVGGGYADSKLSGVSLNWMIHELDMAKTGLLPRDARVREDVYGTSHDPEAGWWGPLYHAVTRNIGGYVVDQRHWQGGLEGVNQRLCVHPSVFARRKLMPPKDHENHQLALRQAGRACLVLDSQRPADPRRFKEVPCAPGISTIIMVEEWGRNCTGMMW